MKVEVAEYGCPVIYDHIGKFKEKTRKRYQVGEYLFAQKYKKYFQRTDKRKTGFFWQEVSRKEVKGF